MTKGSYGYSNQYNAVIIKENAINPTSMVEAPSDFAYSGTIGMRMKIPTYASKVKILANANGDILRALILSNLS